MPDQGGAPALAYLGPDAVRGRAASLVERRWRSDIVRGGRFPARIPLGLPRAADLETAFAPVARQSHAVRVAAAGWGCDVQTVQRVVAGTRQTLAAAVVLADLDTAARTAGGPWPEVVRRGRERARRLRLDEVDPAIAERVLARTRGWQDDDVDILRRVGDWFLERGPDDATAATMTARAVPVPGMHSKWLDRHAGTVLLLTGLPALGLAQRARTVSLHYVDPEHLAAGRRRLDDVTEGDVPQPPYPVQTVVVIENRDCFDRCPPLPGGVAVWGRGDAAVAALAALPWLGDVPRLLYWGDIDARGYAILARVRAACSRPDRQVESVLMDAPARSAGGGTDRRPDGQPITRGSRPVVDGLTPAEREVFDEITDPWYTGPVRYEQEQLDGDVVREAFDRVLSRTAS